MNRTRPCVIVLCLLSVAACADRMNNASNNSGYAGGSGSSGYAGGSSSYSPSSTGSAMTGSATQQASSSYGVIQAIDQMQRQDVGAMGAVGAAAAGGSISGSPTDKVYRVTVRLDDGSTQMVVLESQPGYKIGDRIRYSNGSVQAY